MFLKLYKFFRKCYVIILAFQEFLIALSSASKVHVFKKTQEIC